MSIMLRTIAPPFVPPTHFRKVISSSIPVILNVGVPLKEAEMTAAADELVMSVKVQDSQTKEVEGER